MQFRVIVCAIAFVFSPGMARAQTAAPAAPPAPTSPAPSPSVDLAAERIVQIFTLKHVSPDWFTSDFLAHFPPARLEDLASQLSFNLGAFKVVAKPSVRIASDPPAPWVRYVAIFKAGTDDVLIHINDDGKIDGLVFRTPRSSS